MYMETTIWEEENLIEPPKKLENSGETVPLDITTLINRKFAINEWKDIINQKISGIYKITNKTNGKYYIGSSKDIIGSQGRFNCHLRYLVGNYHDNDHFQKAWNKYGKENFLFEIIEIVDEENLLTREQYYFDTIADKDQVYNISFVAGRCEMTNEIRLKISKSKLGKSYHTKEGIEKQRLAVSGKNSYWYNKSRTRSQNPNWKGGVTHPHCMDCNAIISYNKKRCVKCNNLLNKKQFDPSFIKELQELYTKEGYKTALKFANNQGVTSPGLFYRLIKEPLAC